MAKIDSCAPSQMPVLINENYCQDLNEDNHLSRNENSRLLFYPKESSSIGYKSFWLENKREIVATIALSIVAIVLPVFFLLYLEKPQQSLALNKAYPGQLMATDIKSSRDIRCLQKINDVPVPKIIERARPHAWSDSGFIGMNEDLLDVLQKDWKTVEDLGTTHIEIANHLKSIWDIAFGKERAGTLVYDFSRLDKNTINKNDPVKVFQFEAYSYLGMQGDIFYNETEPEFIIGWLGEAWNGDLKLKNPKNGESVVIAEGVINYIRKYGFYEGGGNENKYRIDPIRLASVFTGHRYCSIANAIGRSCW